MYCLYLTSVNIPNSNRSLEYVIPYIIIATVHTLIIQKFKNLTEISFYEKNRYPLHKEKQLTKVFCLFKKIINFSRLGMKAMFEKKIHLYVKKRDVINR